MIANVVSSEDYLCSTLRHLHVGRSQLISDVIERFVPKTSRDVVPERFGLRPVKCPVASKVGVRPPTDRARQYSSDGKMEDQV